ncbi:MAG: hypothetical protein BMS9Abin09_0246 [Gammaproteobacteria bacterium]|nr:MAG: hypothetical protein BMS9Abin09_0246 [Gammaproteobacteria bacterium]
MSDNNKLSVVVAVQYAQQNLNGIVRNLDPENHPDTEFLFCYTDVDPETVTLAASHDNLRLICGRSGSLIPHLWRDGIIAAKGDRVALTTAHCIPDAGWIERLNNADLSDTPAIGGVIENDMASNAKGWAIFMLRYISFAPPQSARVVQEIAADNALYRRADIMQHMDLLEEGFWEPSFHVRFRAAGLGLMFDPGLRVVQHNRYSTGQFFAQRLAHGRAFGRDRAREISISKRILLIVLSPVLPLVFLRKILKSVIGNAHCKSQLLRALPWLFLFLVAWGVGETRGYLSAGLRTGR